MKTSITLPAREDNYPCVWCGKNAACLRWIEHDVCPEVAPEVIFKFVCYECFGKSEVLMSEVGTFLGAVAYQMHARKDGFWG